MSILIGGNKANKMYWGSTPVSKVSWGATKVWPGTVVRALCGGPTYEKTVKYTEDFTTWLNSSEIGAYKYAVYDMAYGNGRFVGVSKRVEDGSDNLPHVLISTNGIDWGTKWQIDGSNRIYKTIGFGNGVFVALASDVSQAYFYTSTDGNTWVRKETNSSAMWKHVVSGGGKTLVFGNQGDMYYTSNGTSWSRLNLSSKQVGYYAGQGTYGDGKFVVPMPLGGTMHVAISTNGTTWSESSGTVSWNQQYAAYGNNTFVLFPSRNAEERITRYYTSTDAQTWTYRTLTTGNNWANWGGLVFINNEFYALGNDYYGYKSPDGINWTRWYVSGVTAPYFLVSGEVEA